MLQLTRMPARLPGQLRAMIVVEGPQGSDHGKVVGALADMLEPVAHHQAALAVRPTPGLQRHEGLAIPVRRVAADNVFPFVFLDLPIRRLCDGLARVFIQLGFDIETFDVADAATQENPDHGFGPGGGMRPAIGRLPRTRRRSAGNAIAEQKGAQREPGKPHAGV